MILLLAHITGCIFVVIGSIQRTSDSQIKSRNSWINTLQQTQSSDLTNFDIYIASIYWSIETMITLGYGDIVPTTTGETFFLLNF